jgi:tRNA (cmo5U34)-methyltransferase
MPSEIPVASSFSKAAKGYDAARRALIPCYDVFYGAAITMIGETAKPKAKILELGAGTGLFSAMILARLPDAILTLMDASAGMLDMARERFAGRPVAFLTADFSKAVFGERWDMIVSAMAIHHLEQPQKRELFRRIRAALVPGGLFLNADQVLGASPAIEARNTERWKEQAAHLGGTPEAIAAAAQRQRRFDRCATVEDQLVWLREAGFAEVDCNFKSWRFAVMSGTAA